MAVGTRPLVPSRLAPAKRVGGRETGLVHGVRRAPTTTVGGYIALTKPRIIELLLITTLPAMVMAEQGWPPLRLIIATLIGGTLAAGGANAINMFIDRDIDALMERTASRPLVTGLIAPRNALIFAVALELVAFGVLWAFTNLLAAVLAVSATAFYVFVYTIWLKRTSKQNIVIGGAAGVPPAMVLVIGGGTAGQAAALRPSAPRLRPVQEREQVPARVRAQTSRRASGPRTASP